MTKSEEGEAQETPRDAETGKSAMMWEIRGRFAAAAKVLANSNPSSRLSLLSATLSNLLGAVLLTATLYWIVYAVVWTQDDPVARIALVAATLPPLVEDASLTESDADETESAPAVASTADTTMAPSGLKRNCEIHERATLRLQAKGEHALEAVITPSPVCTNELRCGASHAGECRFDVLHLKRNLMGVLTPEMELPVQAVARAYESFVTSDLELIQCTTSQRRRAEERALCRRTNQFERHYAAELESPGFIVLRKLNGPFQVLSIMAAVLLIVMAGRHANAMRVSHVESLEMRLPWHSAKTPEEAYNQWNGFLREPARNYEITGQEVCDASPYLAAHGAAIVAMHSGHNPYEAVDRTIETFQRKAEIAGGLARYLVYAIPTFGFLGTVVGMGHAMRLTSIAQSGDPALQAYARAVLGDHVVVAFDTTMVGLIASLLALALLYFLGQVTESNIERVRHDVHRSMADGDLKELVKAAKVPAPVYHPPPRSRGQWALRSSSVADADTTRRPTGWLVRLLMAAVLVAAGTLLMARYGVNVSDVLQLFQDSVSEQTAPALEP
jgi:hypothetical protein